MKRKRVIIIMAVFILLGMISFFLYKFKLESNDNNETVCVPSFVDDLSAEINSDVNVATYVKKCDNCNILNRDEKIDTSVLGNKNVNLKVSCDNIEKSILFEIVVVDTIPPVITGSNKQNIEIGAKVDLLEGVTAVDNSNEKININIKGEYDLNKEGKYNLKYEASDSSGNIGTLDFTLEVKSKMINSKQTEEIENLAFTTSNGFQGYIINGVTYIEGVLIANKTFSLPGNYGNGLTVETTNAFNEMQTAAALDGIYIKIGSGFRSYNTQKNIYNNYVNRDGKEKADTYSARAGHSEHQSGLAFDAVSTVLSSDYAINDNFNSTKEAKWLNSNAWKFGFILRYPSGKSDITGYKYESWHFRYVGVDLASKLYNKGDWITLEEYFGIDSHYSS